MFLTSSLVFCPLVGKNCEPRGILAKEISLISPKTPAIKQRFFLAGANHLQSQPKRLNWVKERVTLIGEGEKNIMSKIMYGARTTLQGQKPGKLLVKSTNFIPSLK